MAATSAAHAEPAVLEPPPRERPARQRRRSALRGGVFWIVAIAGLLAGVVAINVSVLQLNVRLGDSERERARLRADIAELSARASWAAATTRVEPFARRSGLVPADRKKVGYVSLRERRR